MTFRAFISKSFRVGSGEFKIANNNLRSPINPHQNAFETLNSRFIVLNEKLELLNFAALKSLVSHFYRLGTSKGPDSPGILLQMRTVSCFCCFGAVKSASVMSIWVCRFVALLIFNPVRDVGRAWRLLGNAKKVSN